VSSQTSALNLLKWPRMFLIINLTKLWLAWHCRIKQNIVTSILFVVASKQERTVQQRLVFPLVSYNILLIDVWLVGPIFYVYTLQLGLLFYVYTLLQSMTIVGPLVLCLYIITVYDHCLASCFMSIHYSWAACFMAIHYSWASCFLYIH
jgi:hypothetical protein